MRKIIDFHAHIGEFTGLFNVKMGPEDLINLNKRFGVVKTAISTLPNSLTKQAVREHPNELIGLYWANPFEGEKAVKELRVAVKEWGFKGVKLHPLFGAYVASDPVVYPLIEEAKKLGVIVQIHSGHPPFSLPWSIGELAEVFPDVKIAMIHMGHGHAVYIQAAINQAKKYDNLYLETSGMPMHTKIKEAVEVIGANRVLYGSDIPCHHPSVELQRVKVSGLNEEQLNMVFYENAKKLLRI
jgi:hypothetical protein